MKKAGLSAQAYDGIKSLIINSQLTPGQFITEAEMQDKLNMGRTPIREAVHELARDQLVVIHPRKGIEVSSISPKKIREIFEARKMIEPQILQNNMEKMDHNWLEQKKEQFLTPIDEHAENLDQLILNLAQVDDEFHRKITGLCENGYIDRLMDSLFDYLTMIRISVSHNVARFNESNLEHVLIIESIIAGDKQDAQVRMYKHLDNSLQATLLDSLNSQY